MTPEKELTPFDPSKQKKFIYADKKPLANQNFIAMIEQINSNPLLESIIISHAELDDQHMLSWTELYANPNIRAINLSNNNISTAGFNCLIEIFINYPKIQFVNIANNRICSSDLNNFIKNLDKLKLKSINLANNQINSINFKNLITKIINNNSTILEIELTNNTNISDTDIKFLFDKIKNTSDIWLIQFRESILHKRSGIPKGQFNSVPSLKLVKLEYYVVKLITQVQKSTIDEKMNTKLQEIIKIIGFYKPYLASKLNSEFYNMIVAFCGKKYAEIGDVINAYKYLWDDRSKADIAYCLSDLIYRQVDMENPSDKYKLLLYWLMPAQHTDQASRLISQIFNNLKTNANTNITTQTISKLTGGDEIILFSEFMRKTKKLADAHKHQLLLQAVEQINFFTVEAFYSIRSTLRNTMQEIDKAKDEQLFKYIEKLQASVLLEHMLWEPASLPIIENIVVMPLKELISKYEKKLVGVDFRSLETEIKALENQLEDEIKNQEKETLESRKNNFSISNKPKVISPMPNNQNVIPNQDNLQPHKDKNTNDNQPKIASILSKKRKEGSSQPKLTAFFGNKKAKINNNTESKDSVETVNDSINNSAKF